LFQAQKTNPLEEDLVEFIKTKNRFNGEVYEFTLRLGFLPKHTNEIFYNWQHNSKLEVSSKKGDKIRKGAFYIAYNYYRDDNKKVEFKIK
jgi:hypothetical protein